MIQTPVTAMSSSLISPSPNLTNALEEEEILAENDQDYTEFAQTPLNGAQASPSTPKLRRMKTAESLKDSQNEKTQIAPFIFKRQLFKPKKGSLYKRLQGSKTKQLNGRRVVAPKLD